MVYIAGPYSNDILPVVSANIERARKVAIWCARNNIPFFCPHTHSAFFHVFLPHVPANFYYELDLHIAKVCSAIILLEGWEHSKGAMLELDYFTARSAPVFYWPHDEQKIIAWKKGVL